jgi:ZIP family zinc transporter
VLAHGFEFAESAVVQLHDGKESFLPAAGKVLLLIGGFALGSAGLASLEARFKPRGSTLPPVAGGSVATAVADEAIAGAADEAKARALRTGLIVAAAIGLHNFGEGLAIGVSAGAGQITLATVLIIGFALHNATEGFGIVGPLGSIRPSWRWLGLAGLIGGGPTFVGALVGYGVDSQALQLVFYALAGGAIFYVVGEILKSAYKLGHRQLGLWLLAAGFAAGVLTDFVVVWGGG